MFVDLTPVLADDPPPELTIAEIQGDGWSTPVAWQYVKTSGIVTLQLVDLEGTAGIPAGTSVMVSGNAHTGGTCFGDSGGSLFLGDSNVVAAVTSFGLNGNCAGVGGGYRVDTADDLDWLYSAFGKFFFPNSCKFSFFP